MPCSALLCLQTMKVNQKSTVRPAQCWRGRLACKAVYPVVQKRPCPPPAQPQHRLIHGLLYGIPAMHCSSARMEIAAGAMDAAQRLNHTPGCRPGTSSGSPRVSAEDVYQHLLRVWTNGIAVVPPQHSGGLCGLLLLSMRLAPHAVCDNCKHG